MTPFKRVAKTPEEAKAAGLSTIHSFFRPVPKKGRRTKNSKSAGRKKKNDLNIVWEKVPKVTTPTGVAVRDKKKTRQSWSSGAGLEKLSQAAEDWAIELTKAKEERRSMRWFAEYKSIPFSTFQQHVCPDAEKRIKLGSSVGKKSLIKVSTANVVVDTLIRKDRANQGEGVRGAVDMIEELEPHLNRAQITRAFRRTVRPKFKGRLTNPVAAQHSTTKRSAITVTQQFRWHKVSNYTSSVIPFTHLPFNLCLQTVDSVYAELRQQNAAPDKGVAFEDVMCHFIIGSDEANLLASGGGVVVRVLGDKEKKKHEKVLSDSRESITILRNQPERIKKLKDALELTASLAEISAGAKQEKAKTKAKETSGLLQSADAALQKLFSKSNDIDKLTKKEICAISFRFFGVQLKDAFAKPALVSSLQGLIAAQPEVLSALGPNGTGGGLLPANAAAVMGDNDSDDEGNYSDSDEDLF